MSNVRQENSLLCHVNLASGFRGGERQTQLLMEQFAERGYAQRLVARRGGQLAARCADIPNVEIRGTSSQPLSAALAIRGADLLHAHEARAIYACWLAARLTAAPWLLTRRVDNPFKASWFRDHAYRAATRRVAVSQAICQQIENQYPGVGVDRVADAHAGLAKDHRQPTELLNRYAGKTLVGHIGALDHSHKGQGTIIAAARLAATRFPALHFILVGDGRDELQFREDAVGLNNIEFTGYVTEVDDYLSVFDVFVFPSLHEGLGSTLLDAMSFGLPIVATRVGGIPDIVEDGINGYLIEPEQAEELLAGICKIVDDPALSSQMQSANREKAADYSPAAMADRYERIYRSMLSNVDA
ncbi:MAG: glycosyltransferase family 4 protein [Woeseia sp.]|nr:glycosyltransferase family 4 protein [Woeseia sp.]